jgi:hypothetical protein
MTKSFHDPRKMRRSPFSKPLVLWGTLVLLVFCFGLVIGYLRTTPPPSSVTADVATAELPTREVILYFASMDGQSLKAENRHIEECHTDEDCLRGTIEALIEGPQSALAPILPVHVLLRSVSVNDSLVNLDFSQELVAAHPGGTQSELLTIYGLADTLAVNFPHLRQVQILVEGASVATLKGHVDLRHPINPDFSLIEEDLSPTGKMINLPAGRDE